MSKTRSKRTSTGRSGRTERAEPAATVREPDTLNRWTFLTNHSHVLIVLASDSDLVLREVAAVVGITERAVQRIIHDLVTDGFVERERVGRKNRYRVLTEKPLRHPIEAHRKIGDLIDLISGE